jgi:hypothetical protein
MALAGILDDAEIRLQGFRETLSAIAPSIEIVCHDNAPDFLRWLRGAAKTVRFLSLDHDLGPSREREGERFDPGVGMDVVNFLLTQEPAFPVIVHSSNPIDGPSMVRRLEEAGWTVHRVVPFMDGWIATAWRARVLELLSRPA